MGLTQRLKNGLLALGHRNRLLQLAFAIQGRSRGQRITFCNDKFTICKQGKRIIVAGPEYTIVPFASESFDSYFRTYEAKPLDGDMALDFSTPGVHKDIASGVEFAFPGVPEEDGMAAYTRCFKPQKGMNVFDAGAHAGTTTYFLSRLVGETGHVYAFEPDDFNRSFLEQNIARHGLKNVTVLSCALGGYTGRTVFSMERSMGSGMVEFGHHADRSLHKEVEVVTLEEICKRLQVIPEYVKLDIEGAELGVIESSREFLKKHPIHFASDTYHKKADGELTARDLESLFRSIGYTTESSTEYGYMYTWGDPPASLASVDV